ncbi:hypothetical protein [Microbispora sp. ATCC PTA-5024]|uniref:hypothetical protein n=1 Tax=Microbispora sp. ATCC PTA-5024 TaxID=316330 RepID=UPI0003DD574C|nr:hypothetical protein [Microbispora sp. ATCC PTA-5024]ETK33787.1 hypothetical protein MPTA5024_22895 [Microbispora sp. ATCC PTA-5024]
MRHRPPARTAVPAPAAAVRPGALHALLPVVLAAVLLATGCGAAAPAGGSERTGSDPSATSTPGTSISTSISTSTPRAARPTHTAAGRAAPASPRPVRVPAGVTAGYVVVDRSAGGAGRVVARHDAHRRFRSASVVKILIALDYLERHRGPVPRADLALLTPMLRGSDDDAATTLWHRGGQGEIVRRTARRLGLADTAPPPAAKPGFWGYTAISASDIALVYRYLLDRAQPRVRDLILGNLRQAWHCASDGFDQYFGIPRAVPRPWLVKQGWSGFGSTPPTRCGRTGTASYEMGTFHSTRDPVDFVRPVLHTTGVIGDRLIMVVLTVQPSGASFTNSAARVTKLARDLYLSVA